MNKGLFYNTSNILKLIVLREKFKLIAWSVGIVFFVLVVAFAYPELFPESEQLAVMAQLMENPAMVAMFGKPYGVDNPTVASLFATEMNIFMLATTAIMSILVMTRYTRGDEEDGTLELVKSFPVGRIAPIIAVTIYVFVLNLLIGSLVAMSLILFAHSSFTFVGSWVFGLSIAFSGIVFASIASIYAQLTQNTRTALTFSFATLGFFYILRGFGDVNFPFISYFSPLGLLHNSEVFVNNYLWPLLLTLFISLVLFAFAYHLNNKRDVGSGLLKAKDGKSDASSLLKTQFGLASTLLRTSFITWVVVLFILGASYGSIFGNLEAFFESNVQLRELFLNTHEGSLEIQFLSTIMAVMVVTATLGSLLILFKLTGEEKKGRTLMLYANSLSRKELFLTYGILGIIATFILTFSGVLGMYGATLSVMSEPFTFYEVFISAFTFYPAILVFMGLGMLLMGISLRKTWLIWLYLVFAFILFYFGNMLNFKEWMLNLSPFEYMPKLPLEETKPMTAIITTLIAIASGTLGYILYLNRDMQG